MLQKGLIFLLYCSIGSILLGILFHLQHYHLQSLLFIVGWTGILILAPAIKVFMEDNKSFTAYFNMSLAIILAIGSLLYILGWPYYQYCFMAFTALMVLGIPLNCYKIFKYYRSKGYSVTFILLNVIRPFSSCLE